MPIAIINYGEFRSFKLNLLNNLNEILNNVNSEFHFYFLTEDCIDYDDKKKEVIDIIKIFDVKNICTIKYFENIKNCKEYESELEKKICDDYFNISTPYTKDKFTPKLVYRRCLINKIMNNHNIQYDKVCFIRLFDAVFKKCKNIDHIFNKDDNNIYVGIDTLFIGNQHDINIVFNIEYISEKIKIKDIGDFQKFYKKFDDCLGNMLPFCSNELIFSCPIYNYFQNKSVNLRFDFTLYPNLNMKDDNNEIINTYLKLNKYDFFIIILCLNRK